MQIKYTRRDAWNENNSSSFLAIDGLEDNEEEQTNEKKGKYAVFWKEYGNFIKMGVLDDSANRKRLAKLIRFQRYRSCLITWFSWYEYF